MGVSPRQGSWISNRNMSFDFASADIAFVRRHAINLKGRSLIHVKPFPSILFRTTVDYKTSGQLTSQKATDLRQQAVSMQTSDGLMPFDVVTSGLLLLSSTRRMCRGHDRRSHKRQETKIVPQPVTTTFHLKNGEPDSGRRFGKINK
jgi:hypothetical protein